jgi:hypothetical protein
MIVTMAYDEDLAMFGGLEQWVIRLRVDAESVSTKRAFEPELCRASLSPARCR